MMHLDLRPAHAADDDALVRLAARAPMQADISLCLERAPSFFALRDRRGPGRTLVAEKLGELVGCVSVTTRRVAWDGPREVAYVADLKVAPDARRTGIARELLAAVVRSAPPMLHVGTCARGNEPVFAVLASLGIECTRLAKVCAFQLLPWALAGRTNPARTDIPRDGEAEELAELVASHLRTRRLAPWLDRPASIFDEVPLDAFRVARRGGRIVAALAVWDASRFKQTRVISVPPWMRAMQRVSSVLPTSFASRALPREDSLLAFRYVRYAACDAHALGELRALVRGAIAEAAARGDHFLLFACDERDPHVRALRGLPKLTYRYDIVAWHPEASVTRPHEPHHDDAALS